MHGALKEGKGGVHGEYILNRTQYELVKEWTGILTDEAKAEIARYKEEHEGKCYVDESVSTKWYNPDKDIRIYRKRDGRTGLLSENHKLLKESARLT